MSHIPVLLAEVLAAFPVQSGQVFLDGTVGYGGHAKALLEQVHGSFTYIGLDRDEQALAHCREQFASDSRVRLVHASYKDAGAVLNEQGIDTVDHILLDLGASSPQFDQGERGFSFQSKGPLDMRFDQSQGQTAADILNTYKEQDLEEVIREYGEERHAKLIARALVAARREQPFADTEQLAQVVERSIPRRLWPKRIHPATRVFQALRIEVNQELETIRLALPALIERLKPGGRIGIISFHSLEDRIVKQTFRQAAKSCVCPPESIICTCKTIPQLSIITKRPIIATDEEQKQNPRSRSAKLRIAQKL